MAGIVGLVVSSFIMGLFIHPYLGIIVFLLNVFIVLSLMVVYRKKLDMNESIVLSAGSLVLSVIVSIQAFSWMTGESFFGFLWNRIETILNSNLVQVNRIMEFYKTLGLIDNGYSAEGFIQMTIGQMKDMVPLIPSTLLITSLLLGGLNFLVSRLLLKKQGLSVPVLPPFRRWFLPRGTGRGFFGLMLVAIIGTLINLPNFDVVLYTISSVFTFVFTIQGLSVVSFFLAEKQVSGFVGVLILVAAFILLSFALTFLGIFEQIFAVRRAYDIRRGD